MFQPMLTPQRTGVTTREGLCLVTLLAVYFGALFALASRTGVTVDEPSHILSAILYWEGADTLAPRDMPPLIKIAAGWLAAKAQFQIVEESHPVWKKREEWDISLDMIRRMDERQIRQSMLMARLPLLFFPLGTATLLWWWGRQLFSPTAALILAALFVLEPTALGHGALFKNDHAATFGYLLFFYRAWVLARTATLANAAWLIGAACVAFLAKLSMLILLPIAVLLVAILLRGRQLAAGLLLALAIPYAISAITCQFELRPLTPDEYQGEVIRGYLKEPALTLLRAFTVVPLPIPLYQGFSSILFNNGNENAVYLLGQRYPWGHPGYFGLAALVKSPEPILALLAAGVMLLAINRKAFQLIDALWLLPAPLYFTLASLSSLQLGFRLILPCLPFALLLCGPAVNRLKPALAALLLIATFVTTAWQYPHYIAYFNQTSGGPPNGLKYLSDSNVDWGQSLRELRRWVRRENIQHFHLSYFGRDNGQAYFTAPSQLTWISPPYREIHQTIRSFAPSPGIYAISATLLTGQFFDPPYRDFYKAFRERQPIAYAGYSIYIYRFP